jgi:hypothetical protein
MVFVASVCQPSILRMLICPADCAQSGVLYYGHMNKEKPAVICDYRIERCDSIGLV